jgi:hypothetical protein
MTKQWLLRRAIPIGRAEFKRDFGERDLPPALLGVPRYIIREILIQALRIVRVAANRDRNHILRERFRLNCLIGGALGGRDLYKRRGRKCQLTPEEHA